MYIPSCNSETRPDKILDYVESHPFGALVTTGRDGLFATHLPWVLARSRGDHGVLQGHIARANPHHRLCDTTEEALVIFGGPDAYVTPTWYRSKAEHGKVVPTWNYVAVHVYGMLRFVDDPAFLQAHLESLTVQSEKGREHPWRLDDAPAEFVSRLSRAIVGVELEITRLQGKWKMSQNRPDADIEGVVRGLSASPDPADRRVAELVSERRPTSR